MKSVRSVLLSVVESGTTFLTREYEKLEDTSQFGHYRKEEGPRSGRTTASDPQAAPVWTGTISGHHA